MRRNKGSTEPIGVVAAVRFVTELIQTSKLDSLVSSNKVGKEVMLSDLIPNHGGPMMLKIKSVDWWDAEGEARNCYGVAVDYYVEIVDLTGVSFRIAMKRSENDAEDIPRVFHYEGMTASIGCSIPEALVV